ncbi:unnamed protein product [Clonostachys solani]|uniref:6-phosphogluconolactonase n=1 Tax=Clonostachys solani TaxID=160281 RepID=A0A9N9YUJ0_9HYPO|nr:unnamed protein product [Clonostachys solani]
MKIPYSAISAGALAARALRDGCDGGRPTNPGSNSTLPSSQVLMTTTGNVFLANYDGSKFDVTLKADVTGAPTWVQFVEPNKLYAVNENGDDLRIFNLERGNGKNGSATLTESVTATGSSGVVHLGFNKDNTRLVGAAYGNGTVDVWDIAGGKLELIKTIPAPGTPGPKSPNQDASHPHQANLDPSGRYFAINDLGFDNIMILDTQDDKYEIVQNIPTKAGCGPRHGVWYPSNTGEATHYLVVCEISNEIIVNQLGYSATGVTVNQSQIISTFVSGTAPEGAAAGGIVLHPSNKDVYVTNRLTGADSDTLAHFKIDGGVLTPGKEVATGGVLPRMLSISASGSEIFLGNQNGPDAAVAFGINEDGSVTETPKATLPLAVFGEKGFGPPYIAQI